MEDLPKDGHVGWRHCLVWWTNYWLRGAQSKHQRVHWPGHQVWRRKPRLPDDQNQILTGRRRNVLQYFDRAILSQQVGSYSLDTPPGHEVPSRQPESRPGGGHPPCWPKTRERMLCRKHENSATTNTHPEGRGSSYIPMRRLGSKTK